MLPHQSIVVPIEAVGMDNKCDMSLIEPDSSEIVRVDRSFVTLQGDDKAQAVLTNTTGFTRT